MSDTIDTAVAALAERISSFDGVAKFVLEGKGAIMLDQDGPRAGDDAADVTLTAAPDVFAAIIAGDMNATAAFMSGKLTVDGDMGLAMKLGAALA